MDEALIREQEQQLQKTGKYYKHICWMAVPPLCMACYLYGLRPLLLCGIAMLTGNLCDRLVSLLRHRVYQDSDLSNESFGLVIALLMPVTVDIYVLVAARPCATWLTRRWPPLPKQAAPPGRWLPCSGPRRSTPVPCWPWATPPPPC